MPGKSKRRRAASRPPQPEIADGAFARVVDQALENPAMSGGLVVMAITAMAIMSNAMFLQHGHHPEPLFSTRPAAAPPAPSATVPAVTTPAVPLPRSREDVPAITAPPPPAAVPAPVEAPPVSSTTAMVTSIQRELARLGLYTGAIDGIPGSRTSAAISTWQTAAGIKVTGQPSAELLAALRKPVGSVEPAAPTKPPGVATASGADEVAAAVKRASELEREQAAATQADRLQRVQVALNQIGYGPLKADGRQDAATADSLRRFQLDNGLPVTGELSDRVIARLIAIGAMKPN